MAIVQVPQKQTKKFQKHINSWQVQLLFWYSFMRWGLQLMQIQNEHFLIFTSFRIFSFMLVYKYHNSFLFDREFNISVAADAAQVITVALWCIRVSQEVIRFQPPDET